MTSARLKRKKWAWGVVALVLAVLALVQLERARWGIERTGIAVGTTPATFYTTSDAPAPLVVVAHGFAGSRQLMEAYSLTLARAGYKVLAFDFEGHGRNPVPMSGDVTAIEGTTQLLIDETRRVIDAGLALPGTDGRVALLGHSMASDVIVRTSVADPRVDAVIAVSMFSEAVSATEPERLLAITGQWEGFLREAAVDALRLVDPAAEEGETATNGDVVRRAVVAPRVEHVGVLYSPVALAEARAWLDATFGRESTGQVAATGPWIVLLLVALLFLFWPLAGLLPQRAAARDPLPPARFAAAVLVPAAVAPLVATQIDTHLLPVLVADYLVVHLALQGLLQIALLRAFGVRFGRFDPAGAVLLLAWGLAVFGFALDRYAASFWPILERLPIVGALILGAVPYMLGDALATLGTGARIGRRLAVRVAGLASLGLAVALDFERLFYLLLILPVILLYFLVFGSMGRWAGLRAGPAAAGVALGVVLGWALGVTFPMFAA